MERLAALPGMLVDFREIAGEDHGTVISAAIGRGLDFVVAGPPAVPPVPSACVPSAKSAVELVLLKSTPMRELLTYAGM